MRDRFTGALRQLGLAPVESHTNFVLVPFASQDAARSAQGFLKSRGILIRPMHPYGLEHCLRITLGTEAEMQAVTEALEEWCKR
jgi:histidinol-phosphate aminotransferase